MPTPNPHQDSGGDNVIAQRTGVYQKTDHWRPALTPSGMTSDVSEVTKTDEDVLILNVPDRVTSSETLNVLVRAAIAAFGIAGIIVSIATLVSALLH
jgi:hypothetical protein